MFLSSSRFTVFFFSVTHLFPFIFFFFFFNDTATTEIYTLSLHDALPISILVRNRFVKAHPATRTTAPNAGFPPSYEGLKSLLGGSASFRTRCRRARSEEHTSELQSPCNLVCRLLLEKKKQESKHHNIRPY